MTPRVFLLGGQGKVAQALTSLLLQRFWTIATVIRSKTQQSGILRLGQHQESSNRLYKTWRKSQAMQMHRAGGKGGPERAIAIDRNSAKQFIFASVATSYVLKLLMISWLGCRRRRPSWWAEKEWDDMQTVNGTELGIRLRSTMPFQAISLRPGWISDDKAPEEIAIGHTRTTGTVTREDTARVAMKLLVRPDTHAGLIH
ncbi:hypothetical protein BDV25DRAFT_137090 [Aspergillus avenaceus]|uniref:NAD(P)-binding domain-containing protein n=1 Tax=Aspergillus avenaceus TaxID=36643 RepID=A0A5N6U3N0_ASPAV|nr:hypothetical protein BDV25DRAFT_137090 [Aspergillus avenaceus]